ncbi:MAG TPA: glycosyl hydrolase family 65 protein [Mycobacteriales bacterium]|nr:glycosyl hydrolase family 65 protein [Mycobacteriales bacterium]
MTISTRYPVEPWAVREAGLRLEQLAQSESIFALSNGHIGMRGNLDEGEPHGIPGSYLNSFFESRPLPYAEAGYGYPEAGQTIINVTNGKLIRLLVDDSPFDVRYGTLIEHERVLDLRAGVLRRDAEWVSPAGRRVRVSSTRLVSFTQRAIAAILYEVEPVDEAARIIVQSELVANEDLPRLAKDPRVAAILDSPLEQVEHYAHEMSATLLHRTRASGLRMAAAMDHTIEVPNPARCGTVAQPDWARTTVATKLSVGERLRLIKFVAYGWSSQRSMPSLRDQVQGALSGAHVTGWDGLLAAQREYLDDFWKHADVEVGGDAEVQQAVRFSMYHVLQSGARAEGRAIASKGLTGPGYDGHTFWDTEMFVLPVLTYTKPKAAADAIRWRLSTINLAREHAKTLGLAGAAFPWRTLRGQECSAYWPAGTAAFHINADIAEAAVRYVNATGDTDFDRDVATELLIETARLWRSLGHHDAAGRFRIPGVTGPDEYSAVADDNVYTNLMAQRNLRAAAAAVFRHPEVARSLGADPEEAAAWRDAAESVYLPFNDELGVHEQSMNFTSHAEWDFAGTEPERYPLLLHFPYFDLYRKQIVKQADLVLAMHWRGDAFTPEQKARNFAYYERLTVRDSSLSACTQAVLAAEVGHLALARDYMAEAALLDLQDLHKNTRDGVHMASLAGAWLALVAGFGGMRDHDGELTFAPRLPEEFSRLAFTVQWHGRSVTVVINAEKAGYTLHGDGDSISIAHHGEPVELAPGVEEVRPIPPANPTTPVPEQPVGRLPARRGR